MNEAVQWLLKAIPTYVLTFGRVFVAPKTEILEKCRGEDSAVPGALVFLGVSQLLLYPLARGSTEPHSEFWDTALRSVSLIIVGGLATLGMLALAWRIMGVRIEFSKLLVAYCYISGVSWVVWSVLSLALTGMFAAWYPETYRAAMRSAETTPALGPEMFSAKRAESMRALQAMPGYQQIGLLSTIAFSLPLLWSFCAWGTYRHLASVGRLRSAVALVIFVLLMFPWGIFLIYVDKALAERESQPQKVSAQLEVSKPVPRTVLNKSVKLLGPTKEQHFTKAVTLHHLAAFCFARNLKHNSLTTL